MSSLIAIGVGLLSFAVMFGIVRMSGLAPDRELSALMGCVAFILALLSGELSSYFWGL